MKAKLMLPIAALFCMIFLILSLSVFAEEKESTQKAKVTEVNSFDDFVGERNQDIDRIPLRGTSSAKSALGIGSTVGTTYYDQQHNGAMGRMVETGPRFNNTPYAVVHFGWMGLDVPTFSGRHYSYNNYSSQLGGYNGTTIPHSSLDYAGYVNLDVSPSNEPIVGGHNSQGLVLSYQNYLAYGVNQTGLDLYPNYDADPTFWPQSYIPDSLAGYDVAPLTQQVLWPRFAYQVGTDTVTHMLGMVSAAAGTDPQAIYYFRKVGGRESGVWDYPPKILDSAMTIAYDISVDYSGDKVAATWIANRPNDPNCDTCSTSGDTLTHYQWDNDIYYQVSLDQGQSWEPMVNITKNVDGESGFRPYADLSSLIDSDGNLHVVWSGAYWPADQNDFNYNYESARLFHYSTIELSPRISTIADAAYDYSSCRPGVWNLNLAKMSISECDGKLYALFLQFNSWTHGDDCGVDAANGEIMLSISNDGGATWDYPRNLTNTYTPGCFVYDEFTSTCASEHWPTMSQYGKAVNVSEDWSGATIVDPTGTYSGDQYLDVMYLDDKDPGTIVQSEGIWTLNDVKWFRLPCIEPEPLNEPQYFSYSPLSYHDSLEIGYNKTTPFYVDIFSISPEDYTDYYFTIEEDNGPTGWLDVSSDFKYWLGYGGFGPYGEVGISYNSGSIVFNKDFILTTPDSLTGRIIINSQSPTSPDTVEVSLVVWSPTCCVGQTGDIDNGGEPQADISDLLYLVDYMFVPGAPAPVCPAEADVNGDGGLQPDISDLLYLVDYMFVPGAPEPADCL